ncbi:MAG: hypothetical protein M1832_005101 [Thelocarpon impressellum]|nr:MAG: hypothetical protein M1832_005101 [Thelocarpon impressellum]
MRPSVLPVVALLVSAPACHAWGALGHQAVAFVATNFVSPKAKSVCQELLGNRSTSYLAGVSTWADSFRSSAAGRFSAPFHYIDAMDAPPATCRVNFERDCDEKGCVVAAIANYTKRMGDSSLPKREMSDALKFLVHFIGDVHQPLHNENLAKGGNDIDVEFDGDNTNLHAVWDSNIAQKLVGGKTIKVAKTWADSLTTSIKSGALSSQAPGWLSGLDLAEPAETALAWSAEANALVCTAVLPDGVDAVTSVDLDGAYYDKTASVVEMQVAKAGYRLAAWLNLIADPSAGNLSVRRAAEILPLSEEFGKTDVEDGDDAFPGASCCSK